MEEMELRDDRETTGKQSVTPSHKSFVVVIVEGNTLEEGSDGVVYEASITSVPSEYDPTTDTSFIDGIGTAYLYKNGVMQDDKVLVINSDLGYWRNAAFVGDPITTSGYVSLPVDGSSPTVYVKCWVLGS